MPPGNCSVSRTTGAPPAQETPKPIARARCYGMKRSLHAGLVGELSAVEPGPKWASSSLRQRLHGSRDILRNRNSNGEKVPRRSLREMIHHEAQSETKRDQAVCVKTIETLCPKHVEINEPRQKSNAQRSQNHSSDP